jgi:hypothetical protein
MYSVLMVLVYQTRHASEISYYSQWQPHRFFLSVFDDTSLLKSPCHRDTPVIFNGSYYYIAVK